MILKRRPKEEREKAKAELTLEDLKKRDRIYKEGIAGGVTGAVVGGLTAGGGYLAGRIAKNPKVKHLVLGEDAIRLMKGAGGGVALAGAGLTTAATIKLAKNKKKLKEKEAKEKEGSNDNSEKK